MNKKILFSLLADYESRVCSRGPRSGQSSANRLPSTAKPTGDPVEAGIVKSLARPGGNMTGITMLAFELVGKRLEVLKEAVPKVSRVAVLSSPAHPGEQRELSETQGPREMLASRSCIDLTIPVNVLARADRVIK